jgi:hypothetical protein
VRRLAGNVSGDATGVDRQLRSSGLIHRLRFAHTLDDGGPSADADPARPIRSLRDAPDFDGDVAAGALSEVTYAADYIMIRGAP